MPDLLIRNLDVRIVKRLKDRAKQSGRSLQGEAKFLLEQSAQELTREEVRAMLEESQKKFAGRKFSVDSVDLIREDRDR